jgi:regulator of RNase E activity RraA
MPAFTSDEIMALCQWDTPTICNALEVVVPERRAIGFTTVPMASIDPGAAPIVGAARTGTIRSREPARGDTADRLAWYEYAAADDLPTIVVIQDIDGQPGFGCFWGEVQSNVHKALGALGVVTSGSIRDIPMIAPGFQMLAGSIVPSHAYVHVVDYGIDVNVHGMAVKSGELIHADRHGACIVPTDKIDAMKVALVELSDREAKIIAAARSGGGVAAIKAAMTG